jgi:hypothetical protein
MAFTQAGRQAPRERLTLVFVVAAIAVSIIVKLGLGANAPLWLDETWTGAIISQPTAHAFFDQVYWDVNAPLYYLLMALWRLAFGASDWALRAPSLIFALATPILPLVLARRSRSGAPADGVGLGDRLCWAGLLSLWMPGLLYAEEARCYALLLLLSTAQALVFMRLSATPSLKWAAAWVGVSVLGILTHYYALLTTGFEGVLFLIFRWSAARRLWPALVLFAPAAAWVLFRLPRIAEFARPGVAWYNLLGWNGLALTAGAVMAAPGLLLIIVEIAIAAAVAGRLSGGWPTLARRPTGPLMLIGAGAGGVVCLTVLGMLRPCFAIRYLTPMVPACLLGVAMGLSWLAQRRAAFARAAILTLYIVVAGLLFLRADRDPAKIYSSALASAFIAEGHPKRLLFLLDNPNAAILRLAQLKALGGFFFAREHITVDVAPVVLKAGEDPNALLTAEAGPGDGVMWMYDLSVPGVHAKLFPPSLDHDPAFRCRRFGEGGIGVLACLRNSPLKESTQA